MTQIPYQGRSEYEILINEKGEIDNTVGIVAFLDVIDKKVGEKNATNFDNGGGKSDQISKYLLEKYNITNYVYDPYMRSKEHNKAVLKIVTDNPCDTSTSHSVLNVIDMKDARLAHIKLCYDSVKKGGRPTTGGVSFFKVWKGNGTGDPSIDEYGFQSNKGIEHYFDEIASVYGTSNLELNSKANMIIAYKK